MSKHPKKEIEDEPGAEGRFMREIGNALNTPPRKHTDEPKRGPATSKAVEKWNAKER